jgi:peptidoglycan/LPS O-acetylase OafA/YrhL
LDGLRALAVLCVLGYHMAALRGGYLGVDVFLVLSGFLITGLLLAERDRTGLISLGRFYTRRAFRLLPAFVVFVAVGAVLVVLVKTHDDQVDFLDNAVTSLVYVNNYYRVFRPDSGGAWFGHTWSLSLEEQFYLLWPIILVMLCRRPALTRQLPTILLAAASAVLAWREVLIGLGASGSRIYFGLDTRADALLVGCALAAWLRASKLSAEPGWTPRPGGLSGLLSALPVIGPLAVVVLAIGVATAPDLGTKTTIMDRGGYSVVAVVAGLLILAADQGQPVWLFRLLGSAPLSWLGRISYGFYLWHYPVTGLAGDKLVDRLGRWPATVAAAVVSIALAAASYYLVERPVQRRRPRWASSTVPAPRTTVPLLSDGALADATVPLRP